MGGLNFRTASRRHILVSGASVAGPTVAYWLSRYGFTVTVVERANCIRGGGYPIDIRGSGVNVVEKMGLLPQLRAVQVDPKKITFLHPSGEVAGIIRPEQLTGGEVGRDVELARGRLTERLFDLTQMNSIRYLFDDTITSIVEEDGVVIVTFANAPPAEFDLVIGCDGLHSNTRREVFGLEETFNKYLGYCFTGFTMSNFLKLSHESIVYARPGKFAVLSASGETDFLQAFLTFTSETPPFSAHQDDTSQKQLVEDVFAQSGWEVPRMLDAMNYSSDIYFDIVSQIHLKNWSSGRVVLVGDAAYAPSFLSGQGTSLALVGAFVLAGEIAKHEHPSEAFASYEKLMRPFIEANQSLAHGGASFLLPRTQRELDARNQTLATFASSNKLTTLTDQSRQAHNLLQLPDYSALLQS